jgi:hypothetical protein
MWNYIADGSRMGEATQLALIVAAAILFVGWLPSIVRLMRRRRGSVEPFGRADFERPVRPNRDAV